MTRLKWYSDTANTAAMLECLKKSGTGLDTERKRRLFACACARQFWELLTDARSRDAVLTAEAFADDGGEAMRREKVRPAWRSAWDANADLVGKTHKGMGDLVAAHCCHPNDVPGYAANDAKSGGVSASNLIALFRDVFGDPWEPLPTVYDSVDVTLFTGGGSLARNTFVSALWLTPQVLTLAKAAYAERRPDGSLDAGRLAVLSDAMEEAGCGVEAALRHLRGEVYCSRCVGAGVERERIVDGPMVNLRGGPPLRASHVAIAEQCRGCGGKGYAAKATPCYRGCFVIDWLLGKS